MIVVVIIAVLAMIAIPNILKAQRRAKYSRAAADSKTAVSQIIVYALNENAYPTTLESLRNSGYGNIPDNDPWANPYSLAPVVTAGGSPSQDDDIYVFSTGASATGTYTPETPDTGEGGAVGYSSVYGSFSGT